MNGDIRIRNQMCQTMLDDIYARVIFTELTPWEMEFLDDIRMAMHSREYLSDKRVQSLHQIHSKIVHKDLEAIEMESHTQLDSSR